MMKSGAICLASVFAIAIFLPVEGSNFNVTEEEIEAHELHSFKDIGPPVEVSLIARGEVIRDHLSEFTHGMSKCIVLFSPSVPDIFLIGGLSCRFR